MAALRCVLCGGPIGTSEKISRVRVEGDCVGFGCRLDEERLFHDACLTRADGIDEAERARVLDYLEAFQKSQASLEDLKAQNLERAQKLLREIEWRKQRGP
jgi:hypothetical protein